MWRKTFLFLIPLNLEDFQLQPTIYIHKQKTLCLKLLNTRSETRKRQRYAIKKIKLIRSMFQIFCSLRHRMKTAKKKACSILTHQFTLHYELSWWISFTKMHPAHTSSLLLSLLSCLRFWQMLIIFSMDFTRAFLSHSNESECIALSKHSHQHFLLFPKTVTPSAPCI